MNIDHMKLGIAVLEEYRDAKKTLSMQGWYTTHDCGSAGCAIGYMTMHPYMNALGFKPACIGVHPAYYPEKGTRVYYAWDAVENFFQLDQETSAWLFLEESYRQESLDPITFDMVIARMEHILQGGEPSTF